MTSQQKKEYLADPRFCPYCKSPSITAGDFYGEGDFGDPKKIWCSMSCDECEKTWVDNFSLVSVESEEELEREAGLN